VIPPAHLTMHLLRPTTGNFSPIKLIKHKK